MNTTRLAFLAAEIIFREFDEEGTATVGSCQFKKTAVQTVVPSVATCALLTAPGDEFVLHTDLEQSRDAAFLTVGFAKTGAACEFGRVSDHEALWLQCGPSDVRVFDPPPFVDGVWLTATWTYDVASRRLAVHCESQSQFLAIPQDWGEIRKAHIGPTPGVLVHRVGTRSGADVIRSAVDPGLCGPLIQVHDIRESVPVRPGVSFITGPGGGVEVTRAFASSYCGQ